MTRSEPHSKKSVYLLRISVLALIATTAYAVQTLNNTTEIYNGVSSMLSQEPATVEKVQLGDSTLKIPGYELFDTGNVWALVSKKRPLDGEAGYPLVAIPVAHGDSNIPMKVADVISDELEQIVNAADAAGEPLMVSSAYRSLAEQKKIYDSFVVKNGVSLASLYVLPVGASEHHTGLSVDFSSVSDDCAEDSDTCSLSQSGAAWLAKNAARFGFIQRYPLGKQPTTGVAFESWHYRFVGKPLAQAMATTDLTFDEVVAQIAPGYTKSKE